MYTRFAVKLLVAVKKFMGAPPLLALEAAPPFHEVSVTGGATWLGPAICRYGSICRYLGTNSGASGFNLYFFFSSTANNKLFRSCHDSPNKLLFFEHVSMKFSHIFLRTSSKIKILESEKYYILDELLLLRAIIGFNTF